MKQEIIREPKQKVFVPFEIKLKFETRKELSDFIDHLVNEPNDSENDLFNLLNTEFGKSNK